MSQAITLARPYARAAFREARRLDAIAVWYNDLIFAATVAQDRQIAQICNQPGVLPEQWVRLYLPEGQISDTPFAYFLRELADHARLRLLPEVATLFDQYWREEESRLLVRVSSAICIDDAQLEQIRRALKRRFRREIDIETHLDPLLLGGLQIQVGDKLIDASVRGRLDRLAHTLTH